MLKALSDIDATHITYRKFLDCILIGIICNYLNELKAELQGLGGGPISSVQILQVLQNSFSVPEDDGLIMLQTLGIGQQITIDEFLRILAATRESG